MQGSMLIYVFGAAAVVGALLTISMRHPIQSAMALVLTMLSLAGIYAMIDAHFLALIQILVYVGAIMVLIIYTIMLMDLRDVDLLRRYGIGRYVSAAVGILLGIGLIRAIVRAPELGEVAAVDPHYGGIEAVGQLLFTDYVVPFEAASMLLLAAIVGAMYLARRPSEDKQMDGGQ